MNARLPRLSARRDFTDLEQGEDSGAGGTRRLGGPRSRVLGRDIIWNLPSESSPGDGSV